MADVIVISNCLVDFILGALGAISEYSCKNRRLLLYQLNDNGETLRRPLDNSMLRFPHDLAI